MATLCNCDDRKYLRTFFVTTVNAKGIKGIFNVLIRLQTFVLFVSTKVPMIQFPEWSDVYDKDIVLKLRQQQQHLNLLPDWMPRRDFYKEIASGWDWNILML